MYQIVYIPQMIRADQDLPENAVTQEELLEQLRQSFENGKTEGAASAESAVASVEGKRYPVSFTYDGIRRVATVVRILPGVNNNLVEMMEHIRGTERHATPEVKHFAFDKIYALREEGDFVLDTPDPGAFKITYRQ